MTPRDPARDRLADDLRGPAEYPESYTKETHGELHVRSLALVESLTQERDEARVAFRHVKDEAQQAQAERDEAGAERDAAVAANERAEKALRMIVDFPVDEGKSAGWHFAEVRAIARAVLPVPETDGER